MEKQNKKELLAAVEKDGLFGCVDVRGEMIAPCVWDRLTLWGESIS